MSTGTLRFLVLRPFAPETIARILSMVGAACACSLFAPQVFADEAAQTFTEGTTSAKTLAERLVSPPQLPPSERSFFQYGVALVNEFVAAPGPICSSAVGTPCIFGSGGGISARVGFRTRGNFYLGGAYEVAKLDPGELYRLAIWQQVRIEGRYYLPTGLITEPFGIISLGASGYGNEWGVDTFGPTASLGVGSEFEVSSFMTVGVELTYRAVFFTAFTDSSGAPRSSGLGHVIALDFSLEARDPL